MHCWSIGLIVNVNGALQSLWLLLLLLWGEERRRRRRKPFSRDIPEQFTTDITDRRSVERFHDKIVAADTCELRAQVVSAANVRSQLRQKIMSFSAFCFFVFVRQMPFLTPVLKSWRQSTNVLYYKETCGRPGLITMEK